MRYLRGMSEIFARACLVCLGVCFWGCATAARTEVVAHVQGGQYGAAVARYEREGKPRSVLQALSESLLMQAAQSADPEQQRAAFVELTLLGTLAKPLLESLTSADRAPLVRAQALRLSLVLGDEDARAPLRELSSSADPKVVDAAYAALDPDGDWPLLLDALRAARKERRAAALASVSRSARAGNEDRELRARQRQALSEVARFDPEPQLRAAALSALARHGVEALSAFEAGVQDADADVRSAALRGMLGLDPERARTLLDQQLGAAVSSESIDAAIALAALSPAREPERAWSLLAAALVSPDASLRARAAGSLQLVPERVRDVAFLRTRLEAEPSRSVRLSLALALGNADPKAVQALVGLSESADLTGAEAAAELAPRDEQARKRLRALTSHTTLLVRATAARLIARELHESDPLVKLLADASWQVRSAAAGAVLSVL